MSNLTPLAAELAKLQDDALIEAAELAHILSQIAAIHWQAGDDSPLFRATRDVVESVEEIQRLLQTPIDHILAAA